MKSIEQMQAELLAQCRFDGGYPRPVVMPIGVLAVACNEAEYRALTRASLIGHLLFGVGIFAVLVVTAIALIVRA